MYSAAFLFRGSSSSSSTSTWLHSERIVKMCRKMELKADGKPNRRRKRFSWPWVQLLKNNPRTSVAEILTLFFLFWSCLMMILIIRSLLGGENSTQPRQQGLHQGALGDVESYSLIKWPKALHCRFNQFQVEAKMRKKDKPIISFPSIFYLFWRPQTKLKLKFGSNRKCKVGEKVSITGYA